MPATVKVEDGRHWSICFRGVSYTTGIFSCCRSGDAEIGTRKGGRKAKDFTFHLFSLFCVLKIIALLLIAKFSAVAV